MVFLVIALSLLYFAVPNKTQGILLAGPIQVLQDHE
jgi:hypothetical protein